MARFAFVLMTFTVTAWAQPDPRLVEDLVAANRILAQEGVLDGWGHVSVRLGRDRFLMSQAVAPALVKAQDLVEFGLDGKPIDGKERDLYSERFIHSEIYRSRPDVIAVVHNHAPPLLPFANTRVPLRPMYARSAFIGLGVPVFEIRDSGGKTDMLIRTPMLGQALAQTLADKPAVLMRGHGSTVVGPSIPRVVSRSIFLALNATLQQQAMAMGQPIAYLDADEVRLVEEREGHGLRRAWEAWKRKALAK